MALTNPIISGIKKSERRNIIILKNNVLSKNKELPLTPKNHHLLPMRLSISFSVGNAKISAIGIKVYAFEGMSATSG